MSTVTGMPRRAIVRPKRRAWRWVVSILAVLLVVIAALGGWILSSAQNAVDKSMNGQGGSAIDILMPKPLNNEGTGRVNVLITGNSFDDEGHQGAALTDSITVASMDLVNKKITLISIPRDMWVDYNGTKMKINNVFPAAAGGTAAADGLGDWRKGLDALGTVAERITGLRIDQKILVGYTALKDTVDAVGGIDVDITQTATDKRGIYDANVHLTLPYAVVHINGEDALKLARARNHPMPGEKPYGIADGDFGRGRNQRLIMAALQTKAKTSPALANPAAIVAIFDSISTNVRTDLSVSQIRRLYDIGAAAEPPSSISVRGPRDKLLITDYTKGGVDALVPIAGTFEYEAIQKYIETTLKG
ncbi:transcriptional attenuator, LytR family [Propioniciclava tarda]|nr:transcriptional attenuator, LytR family [Propioniciclava tarda]